MTIDEEQTQISKNLDILIQCLKSIRSRSVSEFHKLLIEKGYKFFSKEEQVHSIHLAEQIDAEELDERSIGV